MCRLVFKQSLHTQNTCPLLIILFRSENIAKKQHADVQAYPMDEDTIAMLNAPNNALIGQFIHQHPMGPIIWEQTRTTNIVCCANNSSPITSTTSGEAAEESLSEYMVKEKASLKQAVPSLLATLDQIIAHPSVGVYIVMVGTGAIEIAPGAISISPQQSTDHILAGQTAT